MPLVARLIGTPGRGPVKQKGLPGDLDPLKDDELNGWDRQGLSVARGVASPFLVRAEPASARCAPKDWERFLRLVPVGEVPERRVPTGERRAAQPSGGGVDAVAPDDRDDHDVLDQEIVHTNEHRSPLDGVYLVLR